VHGIDMTPKMGHCAKPPIAMWTFLRSVVVSHVMTRIHVRSVGDYRRFYLTYIRFETGKSASNTLLHNKSSSQLLLFQHLAPKMSEPL
jgi:hypothetical protein